MLIAISQRSGKNEHGRNIDSLEANYITYLEKFGAKLLAIPNSTKDAGAYFNSLPISGVILSGGNDINPELYGRKMVDGLAVSKERDEIEKRILEITVEKKLPVLGICRGMQLINVYFGGSLTLYLTQAGKHGHVDNYHDVDLSDIIIRNFLKKNNLPVNSFHNQGILPNDLAHDLEVFARSKDQVVEGVFHPDYPIAGIQWHPERDNPDMIVNEQLINAFLKQNIYWSEE